MLIVPCSRPLSASEYPLHVPPDSFHAPSERSDRSDSISVYKIWIPFYSLPAQYRIPDCRFAPVLHTGNPPAPSVCHRAAAASPARVFEPLPAVQAPLYAYLPAEHVHTCPADYA